MDELLAFSMFITFRLILLRTPPSVFHPGLQELKKRGVEILIKPFNSFPDFKKCIFALRFILKNLNCFLGMKNFAFGVKAIYWFIILNNRFISNNASIHAQFATQASIISFLVRNYFKAVEYSFTFHAHDIYFQNRWFDFLVNESKTAFSISNFNLKYVDKTFLRAKKEKLLLARLGVFLPQPVKTRKKKIFILGFLSWWGEKKGLMDLLQATHSLVHDHKLQLKLILAGDGPMREKVIKFIQENDLALNIEDRGRIFGKDKKKFYSDIDVFVLPSIQTKNDMDGIPVVLMEAISYGVPIISNDISGIPEICRHNYNGFLVRHKDKNSLCEGILSFYNMDDKRFQTFKNNAYKSSKEYDIIQNSHGKLRKLGWLSNVERA